MSEQNKANDYALAKYLNDRVWKMLWYVADLYPLYDEDLDKINRSYILLVKELSEIYARNKDLQNIKPEPVWKLYERIDGYEPHIAELQNDRTGDTGQSHTSGVKRLCIVTGTEEPNLNERQRDLISEADKINATLQEAVGEDEARLEALRIQEPEWYIPEYTVSYTYGVILVNGVLRLKKAHDESALDDLMLKALENSNHIFTPTLNTKKTISTVISNAGFTPTLRKLFFPEAGSTRGVLFRPTVSHSIATAEHIDTAKLDLQLKELGATTKPIHSS